MTYGLSWYRRHLWDTITYWTTGTKDKWGDETFSAPTSIKGRWENRVEQFIDFRGETVVSNAIVYLDSEVELDGWLYLGTSASTTPKSVSGAYSIRRLDRLGGFRESDGSIYIAYL